ncbi:hypothetical protein B0I35DRAFT_404052 [Stachybotrys elegans]|uniref:CFEM domain-containing protein n=1 Tax=Stachybotrys elegans TaxID=80388 RepID=A0A8K0T600_9HYPO|nr:hypothetical protein B0I35DRAFT_404052 [Stachybotrys elegans]
MKKAVSLILLAGWAMAQSTIPSCAAPCVTQFTTGGQIAGCQQLDVECICSNADFLEGIACCVAERCDASEQRDAVQYAQQICTAAGVTVPDEVVCRNSSSSESASASDAASTATDETASATELTTATGTATTTSTATPDAAAGLAGSGSLFGAAVALLLAL